MGGKCKVHELEIYNPDSTSVYVIFEDETEVKEVSLVCLSKRSV
jgi:hypothetical protein